MNKDLDALFVIGGSHHTAPLGIRERMAIVPERLPQFYDDLQKIPGLEESLLLSTCNRTELYGVSAHPEIRANIERYLCQFQGIEAKTLARYGFWQYGPSVVQRLFELSAGLDSQRVGETEIFGQIKDAYQTAITHKGIGSLLHQVCQKSFQAAKWIRTHSAINKNRVSIGNIAVGLAQRIFEDLSESHILVVGAGQVGQQTAKALKSRGAQNFFVTSRTLEKAEALAQAVGGQAKVLDKDPSHLATFDILICSTLSPSPLFSPELLEATMRHRPNRPLFLIDLAVPRDIAPEAADIANVFLYNLEDLTAIANHNQAHQQAEADRCRTLLRDRATALCAALGDVKETRDWEFVVGKEGLHPL